MRRTAVSERLRGALKVAGPLLLIGMLAGCMVPPEPETTEAQSVFTLYNIIFAMGVVVFLAVEGMIVYSIFRYRRRDDRLPAQLHGNNVVEIVWTVIPTVIVLAIFAMSMVTLNTVEARAAKPAAVIEVDGFQWQWAFRYGTADNDPKNDFTVTGSVTDPPTMVVPVGEPVKLLLKSQDVIHSFFVPHFLIKRDVIPFPDGHLNTLEFTVRNPGTYAGQCAEFCGTAHAQMTFSVKAVSRAEYDSWLQAEISGVPASPPATAAPGVQTIKISADKVAFSTDKLEAPAGAPFVIEFENKEPIPHNVAIYDSAGKELFKGDIVTGPKTVTYNVPALPAGDYKFQCDVHPTVMFGSLTAK